MEQRISIRSLPTISAIYYALLRCGYEHYAAEKDAELLAALEGFRAARDGFDAPFFAQVRQNTCEVYPYWPRAAALETATFFLNEAHTGFRDFDTYRADILAADNISDAERNGAFWTWIEGFPAALAEVLRSPGFLVYLDWEGEWIERQNLRWQGDLRRLQEVLDQCARVYASQVQGVAVVLNPIKCAYSADYHLQGQLLLFCSGAFRPESVVHEFLHPIVHPFVRVHREAILRRPASYPEVDRSYYLVGDAQGRLNAFEEYAVRLLARRVLAGDLPPGLPAFLLEILARLP